MSVLAILSDMLIYSHSLDSHRSYPKHQMPEAFSSYYSIRKEKKRTEGNKENLRVEVNAAPGLTDAGEGFEALERHAAGREGSSGRVDLALGVVHRVGRWDGHLVCFITRV